VFVLVGAGEGILQDLCRADDQVHFRQHVGEEVLLLALSAHLHQLVPSAQVRAELIVVMLRHQVNLQGVAGTVWASVTAGLLKIRIRIRSYIDYIFANRECAFVQLVPGVKT